MNAPLVADIFNKNFIDTPDNLIRENNLKLDQSCFEITHLFGNAVPGD